MKKFSLILCILLGLSLCACRKPAPIPTETVIETKYYTLTLHCFYSVTDDMALVLREADSFESIGGGTLCTIMLIPTSEDWAVYPNYTLNGILYTPDGDYQVVVLYPTDVQFTEDTGESYHDMYDQLPDVLNSLKPKDGIELGKP